MCYITQDSNVVTSELIRGFMRNRIIIIGAKARG